MCAGMCVGSLGGLFRYWGVPICNCNSNCNGNYNCNYCANDVLLLILAFLWFIMDLVRGREYG